MLKVWSHPPSRIIQESPVNSNQVSFFHSFFFDPQYTQLYCRNHLLSETILFYIFVVFAISIGNGKKKFHLFAYITPPIDGGFALFFFSFNRSIFVVYWKYVTYKANTQGFSFLYIEIKLVEWQLICTQNFSKPTNFSRHCRCCRRWQFVQKNIKNLWSNMGLCDRFFSFLFVCEYFTLLLLLLCHSIIALSCLQNVCTEK